jgi:hypothetical protein
MTQHFHFIFGNEIAVELQITQSGKMLPQTFHKRVLLVCAAYVCNNLQGLPSHSVTTINAECHQAQPLRQKETAGRPASA